MQEVENVTKKEKTGKVYLITNPKQAKYVGSTGRKVEVRWAEHKSKHCKSQIRLYNSINKYSWDAHIKQLIWEGPFELMLRMEHILGLEHNVLDTELGLNCMLPGYGDVPRLITEEEKVKRSNSRVGLKRPPIKESTIHLIKAIHTGKKNPAAKECIQKAYNKLKTPVILYTIDWEEVERFNSMKEAAEFTSVSIAAVCKSCKKGNKPVFGKFRFKYDFNLNEKDSVFQIDCKSGVIVKLWDRLNDAVNLLQISRENITQACNGNYKTAGGFKWQYADPEYNKIFGSTK